MKEQILELRSQGKTYDEVKVILGCSKGTISYHCGKGQKEKTIQRTKERRLNPKAKFTKKVSHFMRSKLKKFKRGRPSLLTDSSLIYEEAFNKILAHPFCYLSGRKIDLEDSKSYHLDHIIPWSKGGSNEITNMGITCRDANVSKYDLSFDEYLSLCKEVLEYNGYEVNKK